MALTKVGKEGVTGISNSSNATAITIDSSENVGIGTTTPAGANGIALTVNATTNPRFRLTSDNTGTGSGDGSGIFLNNSDMYISNEESAPMIFRTSATERMRITSAGAVLVATATAGGDGYTFDASGFLTHARASGGAQSMVGYKNGGNFVGEIRTSTTATSYITSSDYRLKENVTYDWDATTRLKQLKPARFNFIADADTTVDGFIAHEVQDVVPEAITGTQDEVEVWKDGEELPDGVSVGDNKLDDDGNTIPVYQGIDQAKLVPLLVKTIQELEARITALETA